MGVAKQGNAAGIGGHLPVSPSGPDCGAPAELAGSPAADAARARVIAAAATVFRTCGYHQTTMDDIARLSKSSKKTIYKIFSSKEDLFFSLLDSLKHEISLLPINMATSPAEALEKFLLDMARILLTDASLDLLRTIMRAQSENPELARTSEACHANQVGIALEGYLDQLGRSGAHDIGSPEEASRMLIGLALGAFHHEMLLGLRASVPDDALRDRIARAVRIFLQGTRRLA